MLLTIENVFGGYGNGDVLKGISCNADYGDVLCLLGLMAAEKQLSSA